MDEVSLQNFRCFRDLQTVRVAPLTLLVGENSTGKSSFLGLVRALWELAYENEIPDFKDPPYDLGSFDEIAHSRGGNGGQEQEFLASFTAAAGPPGKRSNVVVEGAKPLCYEVTFGKRGTAPYPISTKLSQETTWVQHAYVKGGIKQGFGTSRGSWNRFFPERGRSGWNESFGALVSFELGFGWMHNRSVFEELGLPQFGNEKDPEEIDYTEILQLCREAERWSDGTGWVFASAPVRSTPRRTYDPGPLDTDPDGLAVPMFLHNVASEAHGHWRQLKVRLERFGKKAGLFDELSIRRLGGRDGDPFQIEIRRSEGTLEGTRRNLIDVGFGVSQVLPVVIELVRDDCAPMLLLQQPEVHLHPSAQAALGTLLCEAAGTNRQLFVETHSDHLLDRVRMDVRDGETKLRPEEVSILFFERVRSDVRIHSLGVDDEGNVIDAPKTYRRFFLEETRRSVGI